MLRSTREDLSIPGNVFDYQHVRRDPDELYKWFKKFGDIFGYSERRRNWEKWERRTIAVNTFILFFGKSKTRRWKASYVHDWPCRRYWDLHSRHDNSEVSLLGDASSNIPWPNKISELNREFPSRSLRKGSKQKERGKNSHAERKTGEWILFKWRHLQFSAHACHGTPWDYVERSGRRKENLTPEQISSSVPKVTEHTDVKSTNRLQASPAPGVEHSLSHVIICIIPCVVVTSLETDAFAAFVAYIDVLMVRSNLSAVSRKRRYSRNRCYFEKKVQGCVSQDSEPVNSILWKAWRWDWKLRRDTPESLRMHLVQNWIWEENRNLKELSKKVNFMSETLARLVLRNEHLRKPHDKQNVKARWRGIWREKCTNLSKRDLCSDGMDTSRRRSKDPMSVPSRDREKCK